MLQTIALNLLLAITGILFYTLLESKKYFLDSKLKWNLGIFLSENLKTWVYLILLVLVAAILSGFEPALLTIFNSSLGLNLVNTPAGFFTLGLILKSVLKY